jgi:hypothetical protein
VGEWNPGRGRFFFLEELIPMGNRALVVFHNGIEYSPTVYLHWDGSNVPELLARWAERMETRMGDLSYGTARFVGICHDAIDGPLSLGIWNTTHAKLPSQAGFKKYWQEHGHGDAGVFVVDVQDGAVQRVGGSQSECWAPQKFTAGETEWPAERFQEAAP